MLGNRSLGGYKHIVRAGWQSRTPEELRQKFGRYALCMEVVAALYLEKVGERLVSPSFSEMLRLFEGEALYREAPPERQKPGVKRTRRRRRWQVRPKLEEV